MNDREAQLVTQSIAGDRIALEQLLTSHSFRLSRHLATKVPQSLQALVSVDDIMQQTFLDVFRYIGQFEPRGEGSFWAWLKTISDRNLQNVIKAHGRKKRQGDQRRVSQPALADASSMDDLVNMLSAGSHTPSRSVARHEVVEAIQRVIQGLPEDYRQAVELRLLRGERLEDVAVAMKRSPRAVQGLIDRAKTKMRAALGRLSRFD